jgi:hypothetical protein
MYLARSAFAQKLLLNLSPHVQHGRALVFSGAKFHNRFLSFSIVQKESCLLYINGKPKNGDFPLRER